MIRMLAMFVFSMFLQVSSSEAAELQYVGPNGEVIELNGSTVVAARIEENTGASYMVSFRMSDSTARQFAKLTAASVGQPVSIVLDGKTIAAPIVQEHIVGTEGFMMVTSKSEAENILRAMQE